MHFRPLPTARHLIRVALLVACCAAIDAATVTWTAAGPGNWGDGANWDTASAPLPGQDVAFSGADGDCAINVDVDVASVTITNGYAGIIAQGATSGLVIGAGGWTQDGGTFTGWSVDVADVAVDIAGAFALTNGVFTSTRGRLAVGGDFTVSGGTFAHNTGTVALKSAASRTLTCTQAFNDLTFSDGLIAYWRFEEAASPAQDLSGFGHHAAWVGDAARDTSEKPTLAIANAGSMNLDGVGDELLPLDSPHLRPQTYTIAAWQRLDPTWSPAGPIFNVQPPGIDGGYSLETHYSTDSVMSSWLYRGGAYREQSVSGWTKGAWQHIAATYDGTDMRMYRNGAEVGTPTTSPGTPDVVAGMIPRIGRNAKNLTAYLHGRIDELRVYDRALDATAVAGIHAGDAPAVATGTRTLASAITVAGDLTIASGTLAAAGNAIGLAGSWLNLGGVFSPASATVTLNGTTQTGKRIESAGQAFADLAIAGSGSDWTVVDDLTAEDVIASASALIQADGAAIAASTFTGSGGTFTGSSAGTENEIIRIGGALSVSAGTFTSTRSRLEISGNVSVAVPGVFTHNAGTVLLKSASNRTLGCSSAFNHLVLSDDLIGHWRLEEAASPARDSSGYGHDATWMSTPIATTTTKPILAQTNLRALDLDAGGYLSISDGPHLATPTVTVSAWIYVPTGAAWPDEAPIFSRAVTGGARGYWLAGAILEGQMILRVQTGVGSRLIDFTGVTRDAWHHVCATYDGQYALGYVDGQMTGGFDGNWGSYSALAPLSPCTVAIGRDTSFTGIRTADMLIDEVRVYGTALAPAAVQRLAVGRNPAHVAATVTLTSALAVAGDLTIASGGLAAATFDIAVAGTWSNSGGTFTSGTRTVSFTGAVAGEAIESGESPFHHLQVTGAGAWTAVDDLTAAGDVTVSAGTLTQDAGCEMAAAAWSISGGTFVGATAGSFDEEITVSGAFGVSSGTFTSTRSWLHVGGDFTVAGAGDFLHGSGLVMLEQGADRTLSCTDPFNDLVIRSVGAGGPIAHLRLDETSGTTAADASGNGRVGTYVNTPTPTTDVAPVRFANPRAIAIQRIGSSPVTDSDHLILAGTDTIQAGDYSLSAWFKPVVGSANHSPILMKLGLNDGILTFSGRFAFEHWLAPAGYGGAYSPITSAGGVWHHALGVADSASGRTLVYVDGVLEITEPFAPGAVGHGFYNTAAWYIGKANGYYCEGVIDDVRIYDRALDSSEAALLAGGWEHTSTSAAKRTLGAALDVDGDFTLLCGGLDLASYDATCAGSWRMYEGTFSASGRTVTFDGAAGGPFAIRSGGHRFGALTVSGSRTWALEDPLTCDDALTIGNGALSVSSANHAVRAATMLQPSGTFAAGAGTVVLTSASARNLTVASSLNRLRLADTTENQLVGSWPMDEGALDVVHDVSGQGNSGVRLGADWGAAASAPGPRFDDAGGLSFVSGASEMVEIADVDGDFDLADGLDYTIAGWIRPTSLGSYRGIFAKSNRLLFYAGGVANTRLSLWYKTASGVDTSIDSLTGALTAGAWQHVAVTHTVGTASAIAFYVNGVAVTDPSAVWQGASGDDAPIADDGGTAKIGRGNGGEFFDGRMDDVRFYRRALNAAEILRLANGYLRATTAAGTTWTLTRALDVDDDLRFDSGTLSAVANPITLAGDWVNDVGAVAFVGGTATVSFDGSAQSFTGATAFNAFTKTVASTDVLTFPAGAQQSFAGTLTLQGSSSGLLRIVSSTPGTQALIAPSGSRACSYVWVADSWNTVLPAINPTNSNHGSNHTNWFDPPLRRRGDAGVGYPPRF